MPTQLTQVQTNIREEPNDLCYVMLCMETQNSKVKCSSQTIPEIGDLVERPSSHTSEKIVHI